MNDVKELLESPPSRSHLVQFYGDEAVLVANVVDYLAEGIRKGERVVIIATPLRRDAFLAGLVAAGVGQEALGPGRLAILDAHDTLGNVLVGGHVDEAAFQSLVGHLIADLSGGTGGVRAYGEMVDLLWKTGRLGAAVQLEGCWNRLLDRHRFTLYCAYGVDPLSGDVQGRELAAMLDCHSHLLPVRRGPELDQAVTRAMEEVLGVKETASLQPLIRANRGTRALLPGAEATVIWLRRNLPPYAQRILDRARAYYEAAGR